MGDDPEKLSDHRAADGSRHFANIRDNNYGWNTTRDWLAAIPGVKITEFLSDGVTQAITDFTYRGHQFTIDTHFGDLLLFVSDPACPKDVLVDVIRLLHRLPNSPGAAR